VRRGETLSVSGSEVVSTAAVGVPPTELPRETRGRSDRDGRGPRKFTKDAGVDQGFIRD
jgi:hypothetical protein